MEAPWGHPIISQLIKSQWWGHRAEGSRFGSNPNNPFLNAPICQMALVATAVSPIAFAVYLLTSYTIGQLCPHQHRNWYHPGVQRTFVQVQVSLSLEVTIVDQVCNRWQFYMGMLKEFKEKSPSYLKMVQGKIQEETG